MNIPSTGCAGHDRVPSHQVKGIVLAVISSPPDDAQKLNEPCNGMKVKHKVHDRELRQEYRRCIGVLLDAEARQGFGTV